MSRENVEIMRRAGAEFRWTPEDLPPEQIWDRMAEFWDPQSDYYPSPKFPESRPCHGLAAIVGFYSDYRAVWERMEAKTEVLIPVGDDRVLTRIILSGEGHGSGLTLRAVVYQCVWLRRGRILRAEDHMTPEAALHAFGLDRDSPEAARLTE